MKWYLIEQPLPTAPRCKFMWPITRAYPYLLMTITSPRLTTTNDASLLTQLYIINCQAMHHTVNHVKLFISNLHKHMAVSRHVHGCSDVHHLLLSPPSIEQLTNLPWEKSVIPNKIFIFRKCKNCWKSLRLRILDSSSYSVRGLIVFVTWAIEPTSGTA